MNNVVYTNKIVYTFDSVYRDASWPLKSYHYWRDHLAEDYMPTGINSAWFIKWFLETYNLKWSYNKFDITITAERKEDWIRFQLEWL